MTSSKLRRQIAWHAAGLMYSRQESEYFTAKQKAARQIVRGWVKPADLPNNAEIRDEILSMARLYEGERQSVNLRSMRLTALRMMRMLKRFRPRLIGSVLTGHVRQGSDIDLHVFSDNISAITMALDETLVPYDVERKCVRKERRLKANPSYEELIVLSECDAKGRVPGALAPELEEAIEYIRDLQYMFS